jgi:hypothetical protein
MIRLRGVGFNPQGLRDATSIVAHPDEHRIVAYLTGGNVLFARAGYITDVINPSINGLSTGVMTDGVYAWPCELRHYVETYHVELAEDFVAHMRANDWRPPAEDSIELDDWVID